MPIQVDISDTGSIPASRRSPGGVHGNPLQDSCLENPMDRGTWWVTIHRVANSQTQLKRLSTHACKDLGIAQGTPLSTLIIYMRKREYVCIYIKLIHFAVHLKL